MRQYNYSVARTIPARRIGLRQRGAGLLGNLEPHPRRALGRGRLSRAAFAGADLAEHSVRVSKPRERKVRVIA